ncbi:BnaC01g43210D [Brassica napus]|uniref:BnaC01g43210D protein n=3 Tax=Brassica TaxID=3705 RepID=A0A078J7P9_BRANA|nr:BnaC01g43210D [Brassica napus]VDD51240.1 unnamed protein product [Brassica oleracea]
MIEKIATNVSYKLNDSPSRNFEGMEGLGSHLGKIQSSLHLEKDRPMTLDFPSNGEALEILCRYGFWRSSPHYGFENQAVRVTERCGNLPLGLCVVGSSLRGKSGDEWEAIMHRL